ncbi:MAG: sigma 54-interacting transcriptional regulator [Acidobacteriota bacterium]|nr:sigma 54-interacting transcriptional regulator [Acidobacteriota bacterium]
MSDLPPSVDVLKKGSPSLAGLFEQACRGARSDAPLLILGEPGTGRTALARALHAASERREGTLIEVDPGALPSSLFESEFFGHAAGAFTGADRDVEGRVARAAGGSLLLDHVEETPIEAQPKLLRLLAESRYAPLGGQEVTADVRFLTIGSEDLPQRAETGTFRSDLYFRLEVVTFRVPPLRERMSDLESLLEFFLLDLARRFGRGTLGLAPEAREWMGAYSWPGNLRELRNVLEREVLLSRGETMNPAAPAGSSGKLRSLFEMEREQIVRALQYTRGHQGRAAEILGISRKALWEKRRRHDLP